MVDGASGLDRCDVCRDAIEAGASSYFVKSLRGWVTWCEACRVDSEHRPRPSSPSEREIKRRIEAIGDDLFFDVDFFRG